MNISRRAKIILLGTAGVLLLAALVLELILGGGEQAKHCAFLQGYGYHLDAEDLYFQGMGTASIREVLPDVSLDPLVAASQRAGLPSDVDRRGEITLMLLALENSHVVTVYLLDGEPELGFVQIPESDEVYPLGE